MTDLTTNDAVLSKTVGDYYDISFNEEGDIETDAFLDTALLMSLFCEKRASEREVRQPERRRGWIGNESTPGFEIGSKIWLYEQAKITKSTLNGIKTAAENGLNWLLDEGILPEFEVSTSLDSNANIVLQISLFRTTSRVDNKFYTLWDNSGRR